jgi:hypothetical protein
VAPTTGEDEAAQAEELARPRSNHASDSEDEDLDVEVLNVIEHSGTEYHRCQLRVANPPKDTAALTKLPNLVSEGPQAR